MIFLKKVREEIVATVRSSIVLFISIGSRVANKIFRLPRIIYIPILFLFSISFCLFLSFFMMAAINGQRPWSSLDSPPDSPIEILDANHNDILVKTVTGKIFRCTYDQNELTDVVEPIRPDESCWQETPDETLEIYDNYDIYGISKDALSWWIKKPGKAVDTLSFTLTFIDTGYSRSHIIDETGEVWVQEAEPSSIPDPEFYLPILIGIFGGIILSIVILTSKLRSGR